MPLRKTLGEKLPVLFELLVAAGIPWLVAVSPHSACSCVSLCTSLFL